MPDSTKRNNGKGNGLRLSSLDDKETTDDHKGFALSGLKIINMHISNI